MNRSTVVCSQVLTYFWRAGNPNGPTAILIHGFQGNHSGLASLARQLRDFNLIIPDLPSHGLSGDFASHTFDRYAGWLDSFVEALGVKQPVVVGHSLGGLVALMAARHHQDWRALVLIVPVPLGSGLVYRWASPLYRAVRTLPGWLQKLILGNRLMSYLICRSYLVSRNKRLWHRQYRLERYEGRNLRAKMATEMNSDYARHDFLAYAHQVKIPTLLIGAEKDRMSPFEEQVALSHNLSDCRLIKLERTGHFVHIEKPRVLANLIRDFVS